MIWRWIWQALSFLARLIIPPPRDRQTPTIDWGDKPCPACGHTKTVTVEYRVVTTTPGKIDGIRKGLMRFTCSHCKAFWHTDPLYKKVQTGGRPIGPDEVGGKELQGMPRA